MNKKTKHYSSRELSKQDDLVSLRHRKQIKELASGLSQIDNVAQFCLYIQTPFHQPLHLTTADQWSVTYNRQGFDEVDLSCDPINGFASILEDCYFVREKDLSSDQQYLYTNMAAYQINETVALVRRCKEAYIVGVFHHDAPIENPTLFYGENKNNLEEFMDDFFDGMENIVEKEHPILASTKLMKNKLYRKKVIRNAEPIKALSSKEICIIKLIASGILLKEVPGIMNISEKTVRNYIEHAHRKLNTNNLTQTVITAYNLGLIK